MASIGDLKVSSTSCGLEGRLFLVDQVEITPTPLGRGWHRFVASIWGALVKQVTLTFDNGPVRGITDRVLNILDRMGFKTTLFVIGRNLLDPDAAALMREAQSAGHWIGNHTLTHSGALGDRPEANYSREEIEGAHGCFNESRFLAPRRRCGRCRGDKHSPKPAKTARARRPTQRERRA